LEPDPATAPIVGRIFWEFLHGQGLYLIAEGLTKEGIPCPSAYDRARSRRRSVIAWSKSARPTASPSRRPSGPSTTATAGWPATGRLWTRGGDPQEIGKWMAETRAERLKAEGRLRAITRKREIGEKEIAEVIPRWPR